MKTKIFTKRTFTKKKDMNYQIITDEEQLRKFIDWLPVLDEHEVFYICLFARSKYVTGLTHVRSDKAQLKRFTSNKEMLFTKIKQLECPLGSYTQRGVPMPQEALGLYITINPRDMRRAAVESTKKLLQLVTQEYNGYNPHQEVMSEIQKAKSRTEWVSFDFDVPKEIFPSALWEMRKDINDEAIELIETRGGFHLLVSPGLVYPKYQKTWYLKVKEIMNKYSSDKDNIGDLMLPVVGTYQGGFTPKFHWYDTRSKN